jgi:two-component system, sensor histidine kinase
MLHSLLEMWGCRVVEACNGLEAVEAASREKPELILMDGRLPFLDGLEATRRIRENGLRDQVKIVALQVCYLLKLRVICFAIILVSTPEGSAVVR